LANYPGNVSNGTQKKTQINQYKNETSNIENKEYKHKQTQKNMNMTTLIRKLKTTSKIPKRKTENYRKHHLKDIYKKSSDKRDSSSNRSKFNNDEIRARNDPNNNPNKNNRKGGRKNTIQTNKESESPMKKHKKHQNRSHKRKRN
jgi:hypothetical protein